MSSDLINDRSFKAIDKLVLYPFVGLLGLVLILFLSMCLLAYYDYVPQIISFIAEFSVPPEALDVVESLVYKLVFYFGLWTAFLIVINGILVNKIWHAKKLTAAIKEMDS